MQWVMEKINSLKILKHVSVKVSPIDICTVSILEKRNLAVLKQTCRFPKMKSQLLTIILFSLASSQLVSKENQATLSTITKTCLSK